GGLDGRGDARVGGARGEQGGRAGGGQRRAESGEQRAESDERGTKTDGSISDKRPESVLGPLLFALRSRLSGKRVARSHGVPVRGELGARPISAARGSHRRPFPGRIHRRGGKSRWTTFPARLTESPATRPVAPREPGVA